MTDGMTVFRCVSGLVMGTGRGKTVFRHVSVRVSGLVSDTGRVLGTGRVSGMIPLFFGIVRV